MNLNFFTKPFLVFFGLSASFCAYATEGAALEIQLPKTYIPTASLQVPQFNFTLPNFPAQTPNIISGAISITNAPDTSVTQRVAEKLSSSNLNPQQMALIAAGIVAAGGAWHLYNKNYIQPTDDIIHNSFTFLTRLFDDPLFYLKDPTIRSDLKKYFNIQKNDLLRALGLKNDIFNTASYFQKKFLKSYVGDFNSNAYLSKLVYVEYEKIDRLFEALNETLKIPTAMNLDQYDPNLLRLKNEIIESALDPYIYLLKAKSTLKNEVEKNSSFTEYESVKDQAKRAEALSTIDKLILEKVIFSASYKPVTYVRQENEPIFKLLDIFEEYLTNPTKWNLQASTYQAIGEAKEKIDAEKSLVEKILYGNWVYNKFANLITSKQTSEHNQKEKAQIEAFYNYVRDNIGSTSDEVKGVIKRGAAYIALLILKHLTLDTKLSLIKDYYQQEVINKLPRPIELPPVSPSLPDTTPSAPPLPPQNW